MKHLFGTDGIRGVAGEPPLDAATVYAVGWALGDSLGRGARVVVGQDTRQSSAWIAATLTAGLEQRGVAVAQTGVLPTPAVAFLTVQGGYAAGIMISASHNPFQDNGIKVFGATGYKLPDEQEAVIEAAILGYLAAGGLPEKPSAPLPHDGDAARLRAAYVAHLASQFPAGLAGLRLAVDCAHGAASTVAADVFTVLGAKADMIANQPTGVNINAGVGALHPENLAEQVVALGADAGLALDGDADRAILVDAHGKIVNGDAVLLMAARELRASGHLEPPIVVGTVMTNLGLELVLQQEGIRLERAPVGDKYVLDRMRSTGAVLGGEPSGHVIFGAEATTGDGLLTALHCFDLVSRRRRPLHELCDGWVELPQRIINIRVREKTPLQELQPVQAAIQAAERHFAGSGRVLVRYSGTEKLVRVMVEAQSATDVESFAASIAAALQAEVGV